ncbi:MAG: hypothetical protein A3I05_06015 [Deltaproteobacteria bacterium RIFCSPLOWO2_02_FULL_44_10]|nr:MAG: hypothetical protein A3C46_04830 [Deltaproteobacteria bacterium RIFCSPHIGHO2_02_FULL_44_16]OGQ46157.1 MAG: hypothetical protein A3I05_06015 [Deltaproteobacteria bacterium RIFCSPLOWO2_02_FULL_44_10]
MWSAGKFDPVKTSRDILAGKPFEDFDLSQDGVGNISETKTGEVAVSELSPDQRAQFADKTRTGFQTSGLWNTAKKWTAQDRAMSFAHIVTTMLKDGRVADAFSLFMDGMFEQVYCDAADQGLILRDDSSQKLV